MKVSKEQISNMLGTAFAFAIGLVVLKLVSKYFGNGQGLASKLAEMSPIATEPVVAMEVAPQPQETSVEVTPIMEESVAIMDREESTFFNS